MSWNYRILWRDPIYEDDVDLCDTFGIYEVFYDSDGKANSHAENPSTVVTGEWPSTRGKDGLLDVIQMMLEAWQEPILNYGDLSAYIEPGDSQGSQASAEEPQPGDAGQATAQGGGPESGYPQAPQAEQ